MCVRKKRFKETEEKEENEKRGIVDEDNGPSDQIQPTFHSIDWEEDTKNDEWHSFNHIFGKLLIVWLMAFALAESGFCLTDLVDFVYLLVCFLFNISSRLANSRKFPTQRDAR